MNLNENIERILVSKEEIAKRTAELGDRISRDYKGKRPLLVCVLKGSVMFFSDLVRRITEDVELDLWQSAATAAAALQAERCACSKTWA